MTRYEREAVCAEIALVLSEGDGRNDECPTAYVLEDVRQALLRAEDGQLRALVRATYQLGREARELDLMREGA